MKYPIHNNVKPAESADQQDDDEEVEDEDKNEKVASLCIYKTVHLSTLKHTLFMRGEGSVKNL